MRISDWSSDVCSSDLRKARYRASRHDPPRSFRLLLWRRGPRPLPAIASQPGRAPPRGGSLCADRAAVAQCPRLLHTVENVDPSGGITGRSEEHTSELQSLMRISYAVFCLKKKNHDIQ